jgi:hypothetical protein
LIVAYVKCAVLTAALAYLQPYGDEMIKAGLAGGKDSEEYGLMLLSLVGTRFAWLIPLIVPGHDCKVTPLPKVLKAIRD